MQQYNVADYIKTKINIGVPEKRKLFGEKEEQRYECRGDFKKGYKKSPQAIYSL